MVNWLLQEDVFDEKLELLTDEITKRGAFIREV